MGESIGGGTGSLAVEQSGSLDVGGREAHVKGKGKGRERVRKRERKGKGKG